MRQRVARDGVPNGVRTGGVRRWSDMEMGLLEFLMLFCFGFSWPFSIAKSIRSKTTKGKSLAFMLLVFLGYVFGIVHKVLYDFNWVTWAYVVLLALVGVDLALYWVNGRREGKDGRAVSPDDAETRRRRGNHLSP